MAMTRDEEEAMTDRIVSKIRVILDQQREEIIKSLKPQFDDLEAKITDLSERLKESEHQLEDFKQTARKKCTIVVNGIPHTPGENVRKIYTTISSLVGYSDLPPASVFRMPGSAPNRPICIKLETDLSKEWYMSGFFRNTKSFVLGKFEGFTGETTRVYLGDDLSTRQYGIHKQALAYKKAGKVHKMKTHQGIVLVKIAPTSPFSSFSSINDLITAVTNFTPKAS